MSLQSFIALWKHRYRKYSHIAKAHLLAYRAQLYFSSKKRRLKKDLVAVIRTEHFGDIVAVEPLSRQVRALHPDAHIVWFVKPVFKELVDTNPNVDESFPEFCVTQRQVLLKTSVFDQVYELQFRNNNHCPVCDVFVENPLAIAKGINVHTYFNFGNLLEVFAQVGGLPIPKDEQPRLYLQERHQRKVDTLELPERFIAVHCQSNYAPKDWPADRWNALIPQLADKYGMPVVEMGLASNLAVSHPAYRNLCGRLSILETAEVIRRAEYFIGLDSGPAHLANASGTFGFVLMGSLNEFASYNPYSGAYGSGANCVLIRQEGYPCSQLPLNTVLSAIDKKVSVPAK
ncbi:glycosyltransferase family 9 protein [Persicitalea jodogahamensis]|uniref:Heptosyltransferase n=1 Tax=Persicitalea jodogahamensis TaxID=402147 RepID=A0A8J3G7Z2_9BACT|nr:glycosyltransferase family 9 protein [Persicitalea jodogahamensis]GHB60458.1 heptosyltransferase [Persicitalea jodogahamensis]